MIDARIYKFVLLLVTLTAVGGYTLQKCCPLHQHLDTDFLTCINVSDANLYNVTEDKNTIVEVIGSSGFPWWFPQDAWILSADNWTRLSPNASFLGGEFPLQVSYGVPLPCSFHTSQLLPGETFLDDGSIVVENEGESVGNMTYPSISYCVDSVHIPTLVTNTTSSENAHIVKLCPCLTNPCVRKCCGLTNLIRTDERGSLCVFANNITDDWKPRLLNGSTSSMHTTLIGKQRCEKGKSTILFNPTAEHKHKFWILENGWVHIDKPGVEKDLHYKDYCAEITEYEDGTRAPNLVYCDYVVPIQNEKEGTLFGVLFLIGAMFLLATLLVYAITPELRSLHGNNLMAHSASFLVAYIAMAAGQLAPQMPFKSCVAVGFIIQFSFLAAFFWLNVMCIDISWTFSGFRPPPGSAKVRDQKKFRYYSVYAWGSTTLISVVTAIMEFTPSIHSLKPNFGQTSCLFKEAAATLVYFYIPMALLLITNLALFLFTAARIIRVKQQTAILHKPGSAAYNKEKQRLILYIKLFLLMGITWVTEIISWAVGGPEYYWYLTDILNLLRAVFIFIIFCCKRQVYHLLQDRARSTFKLKTIQTSQFPKQENPETSERSINSSSKRTFPKTGTSSSSFVSRTQETVINI